MLGRLLSAGRLAACAQPLRLNALARGVWTCRSALPAVQRRGSAGGWQQRGAAAASSQQQEAHAAAASGVPWEELEARLPTHCSGCGVELQQEDPGAPG